MNKLYSINWPLHTTRKSILYKNPTQFCHLNQLSCKNALMNLVEKWTREQRRWIKDFRLQKFISNRPLKLMWNGEVMQSFVDFKNICWFRIGLYCDNERLMSDFLFAVHRSLWIFKFELNGIKLWDVEIIKRSLNFQIKKLLMRV